MNFGFKKNFFILLFVHAIPIVIASTPISSVITKFLRCCCCCFFYPLSQALPGRGWICLPWYRQVVCYTSSKALASPSSFPFPLLMDTDHGQWGDVAGCGCADLDDVGLPPHSHIPPTTGLCWHQSYPGRYDTLGEPSLPLCACFQLLLVRHTRMSAPLP